MSKTPATNGGAIADASADDTYFDTGKPMVHQPAGDLSREEKRSRNLAMRELSFDEVMANLVVGPAAEVLETEQFGPILTDKGRLCGLAFAILEWEFHKSDMAGSGEFVSMKVVTETNNRYIVNDGSTGIYQQLRETTDRKGITMGVYCPHGLRVSEYTYVNDAGKEIPAKTYYIDDSI